MRVLTDEELVEIINRFYDAVVYTLKHKYSAPYGSVEVKQKFLDWFKENDAKTARLVREETLKEIIKWGMEECPHKRNYMSSDGRRKKPVVTIPSGLLKRECPICWAEKLSQGVMP